MSDENWSPMNYKDWFGEKDSVKKRNALLLPTDSSVINDNFEGDKEILKEAFESTLNLVGKEVQLCKEYFDLLLCTN